MRRIVLALSLFSALVTALGLPAAAWADRGLGMRTATLLTINDVYRISGVEEGSRGGIPRVRTLRAELEKEHPDLLLLHAGDILFPSVLSRAYNGEQMIDLMNRLDGDAAAFDDRFWVTFGNHEFDNSKAKDFALLQSRIKESQFAWLGSNIRFKGGEAVAENLHPSALVESGGIRIGLFSLTTDTKIPEYVESIDDPEAVARAMTAELRMQGAEVVVALTHLRASRDVALLEALGDAGPDLIIGGHEHDQQVHSGGGHRLVIKADADARTAALVKLHLDGDGRLMVGYEFKVLDEKVTPAEPLQAVAEQWQARFDHDQCLSLKLDDGCLAEPLGRTQVKLVAEELEIRKYETNLGSWIADQALAAYKGRGAQIAFINAGSLRMNQDLPAGTELTRRHLLEIFAYPSPLGLLEIDGATLQKIADNAVHDWTGNGWWLQLAGFSFRHDPETDRAYDLTLLTPDGPRAVKPEEKILAVTSDFVMAGGDGYTMLTPAMVKVPAEGGPDLRELVREALAAAEPEGIAPEVQGRVCNTQREGPCLAVAP